MSKRECKFGGCNRNVNSRGYCYTHYVQLINNNLDDTKLKPIRAWGMPKEKCKFKGCTNKCYSKGYCPGHYQQLKRANGDKSKLKPLREYGVFRICKFPGCENRARSKQYCFGHYSQLYKNNFDETQLTPLKEHKVETDHEILFEVYSQAVMDCIPNMSREKIKEKLKILGISHVTGPYVYINESGISTHICSLYTHEKRLHKKPYKTTKFARHLMELHEERFLGRHERVYHVDEDSSDCHLTNLCIRVRRK